MSDRAASIAGLVGGLVLLVSAATATTGCSLMLDLEQCSADDECGEFSDCVEGICKAAQRESVSSHIVTDTTWTSDKVYVLEDMIMVIPPATLTIEPGTQIRGKPEGGLVSRAGAKIEADGTREEPIVFTSDQPVGQRQAGDWAGLGLVGEAPTNREDFQLRIDSEQHGKPVVGGDDESWDCGTLRYVRVEFGGSKVEVEIDGETELKQALNGITLAGCGSETDVDYVQSHLSDDDGIVVFGGTVDLRHAVSTRPRSDNFGFDTGWRGTAQYLAGQQQVGGGEEEAIQIQNLFEDHLAEPKTEAKIYNYTILGTETEEDWQLGAYFKRGGKGILSHGILQGQSTTGLYVEGKESAEYARNGDLRIEQTLFNKIGPEDTGYFALVDTEVEDDFTELISPSSETPDEENVDYEGFGPDDYEMFRNAEYGNLFGEVTGFDDPYNLDDPGWVPHPEYTTGGEIDSPPEEEGFDTTGSFRGAFRPGATPWTEGWTNYPRH